MKLFSKNKKEIKLSDAYPSIAAMLDASNITEVVAQADGAITLAAEQLEAIENSLVEAEQTLNQAEVALADAQANADKVPALQQQVTEAIASMQALEEKIANAYQTADPEGTAEGAEAQLEAMNDIIAEYGGQPGATATTTQGKEGDQEEPEHSWNNPNQPWNRRVDAVAKRRAKSSFNRDFLDK